LARSAVTNQQAEVDACFDRQNGNWIISGLSVNADIFSQHDLESLSSLKTLVDLGLGGQGKPPEDGLRYLAAMPQLRRFGTSWYLSTNDLHNISLSPALRELIVNSYSEEAISDDGLANLKRLRTIDLAGRKLSNNWANSIKVLTQLRKLNVDRNAHVTNENLLELRGITNLRELRVGGSQDITDAGLAALKSFTDMRYLEIPILGPIGLEALKNCPHLEHLTIGGYSPGPADLSLADLPDLKWFSIGGEVGGKLGSIQLPARLKHLGVRQSTAIFINIESAKRVEQLDLTLPSPDDRKSTAQNLDWLGQLPELQELNLYRPLEEDLKSVAKLKQLRSLHVFGDCLSPIGNNGARSIGELPNLESLEIDDYFGGDDKELVVNSGILTLGKLVHLRRLTLHGFPSLSTANLCDIARTKQLKFLELDMVGRSTVAMEQVVNQLKTLRDLEELTILRTKLNERCVTKMREMKYLRRLKLAIANDVTDEDLANLMKSLPALQSIEVSFRIDRMHR
jgi:hypothetical protein